MSPLLWTCICSCSFPAASFSRLTVSVNINNRLINTINDLLRHITAINIITMTVLATFFIILLASISFGCTTVLAVA